MVSEIVHQSYEGFQLPFGLWQWEVGNTIQLISSEVNPVSIDYVTHIFDSIVSELTLIWIDCNPMFLESI